MQAAEELDNRIIFCETHGKKCTFTAGTRCACCGKRVCLCNYVL
jgi:hypothetical protein